MERTRILAWKPIWCYEIPVWSVYQHTRVNKETFILVIVKNENIRAWVRREDRRVS